jgi:putative membrane protein
MSLYDLPAVNATLNGLTTILLLAGWFFIRRGQRSAHIRCMVSALVTSAVFLACYLFYHFHAGSVKFTHPGIVRTLYLSILLTHTVLAVVNLPLIIATVIPAVRQRFDKHRRLARWTLPIWLYVSVTGVIVYVMLYQLYPPQEVLQRRTQAVHRG